MWTASLNLDKLTLHFSEVYKSQFDEQALDLCGPYFDLKAKEYAKDKGFTYGETFKVLRPVQLHCFVDAWKS